MSARRIRAGAGQDAAQQRARTHGAHGDGAHVDGAHKHGAHEHGAHGAHDHSHDHPHRDDHPHGWLHALGHLFAPHSHDPADSVDDAMTAGQEGISAVKISLVVLALTALAQAAVVAVTGSVALLADTIHNVADALTSIPLWIAFVLGRRAATSRYTYGYGRAEDLAGLFIVAMIALSAAVAGVESVRRLLHPQPLTFAWAVMLAGLIGFAGNELVAIYRIRVGRRIGSAALVADGVHARTDGLTSLAVVVGALGVVAGFPIADPVIGLLITLAILILLRGTAREIWRRLMDGVDPALTRAATEALAGDGVREVLELRLRWLGHRMRAEATLAVDPDSSLADADATATAAQTRLRSALPRLDSATIRTRPTDETLVSEGDPT